MKHLRFLAVLTAIMLFVVACTGEGGASSDATESEEPETSAAASMDETGGMPDELVIGFVPSREADALVDTIQPVADALSEALGIPVEGYVATDYTGLVTAMQTGQAQIGAFGPFAMVQAVDNAGAEMILQSERNGSGTYHTQFFTNDPDKYCDDEPVEGENGFLNCNGTADADNGPVAEEKIAEIAAGTTVSFVEQASASGYIFPATIFLNNDVDPEEDIEPLFAGSHDASVIAVCNGDAEVGVSFDDAREIAETDCDIASNVVVFAYGPEIPNDGFAVAGDLSDEAKEAIKQALLAFASTDAGAETLDEIYQISALTEPDLDSLDIVRDAAELVTGE